MKRFLLILLILSTVFLSSCEIKIYLKTSSNSSTLASISDNIKSTSIKTKTSTSTSDILDLKEKYSYDVLSNMGVSISKKNNITTSDLNKVNLVEINDTHGELIGDSYYMSLAQVGGIIDYLDSLNNSKYIKIMNGDLFQGSYISRMTYGKCMIDALNSLDFDFMTIGNHEFDWTLDKIEIYFDGIESNGEANFPLVCCNLLDKETDTRPEFVEPYHIIEYGDIRVGIIGAIGSSLETSIDDDSIGNYYFDALDSYIKEYTLELRNYGCDVVILSVHDYDSNYSKYANYKYEYRIDAMIFGHTHESVDGTYYRKADGYEIPYIQSYTKNANIGTITIHVDENNVPLNGTCSHYDLNYYNTYVKNPNEECSKVIDSYMPIVNEGNETIYEINVSDYNTKEECADFGIKALMELYDCDMGFVNSGGVRATLKNKNVSIADIFEIYPFDNRVVLAYMKGDKLKQYLSQNSGLYTNADFDRYDIDESKTYKICTIEYIAKKYDNYMKYYCVDEEFTIIDDIMRDKVVEYYKNLK